MYALEILDFELDYFYTGLLDKPFRGTGKYREEISAWFTGVRMPGRAGLNHLLGHQL
jgi:hypothetical protein